MKTVIYLLLVSLITVSAKRYCYYDADCSDLGDLVCMKSMCEAGICGCPRGLAARFIGSQNKFTCVQIRTIGEECSTDFINGICGAENSFCDNNVCKCEQGTTHESRWGGEACLTIKEELVSSESCSTGLGETGLNCKEGQGWGTSYTGDPIASLMSHPLDGVPNVASCTSTPSAQTNLGNNFDDSPYMGGFRPECEDLRIGDVCLSDKDCNHIQFPDGIGWQTGGAKCVLEPSDIRRTCQCTTGTHVSDITGYFCATGLELGATCTAASNVAISSAVCDGTKGLRCGDPCDHAMIDNVSQRHLKCVCDPGWEQSNGNCVAVKAGASCYGDYNCKSLGVNAACIGGKCQQSAHPWSGAGQLTSATTLVWSVGLTLVAWMRML